MMRAIQQFWAHLMAGFRGYEITDYGVIWYDEAAYERYLRDGDDLGEVVA